MKVLFIWLREVGYYKIYKIFINWNTGCFYDEDSSICYKEGDPCKVYEDDRLCSKIIVNSKNSMKYNSNLYKIFFMLCSLINVILFKFWKVNVL